MGHSILIYKQITGASLTLWTRFQECLLCPWGPDWQMTRMLHIYRPRRFQRTWFGVNRPSGCWVPASAKFQETLSCPWACPYGQMTKMLHIYRPRQFQWTLARIFGVNRPSGCWVPASAKFQETLSCPWACPYGQMTKMLHIYRPRQFQWTWFGVNWPSGYWVMASAKFGPDGRMNEQTESIP